MDFTVFENFNGYQTKKSVPLEAARKNACVFATAKHFLLVFFLLINNIVDLLFWMIFRSSEKFYIAWKRTCYLIGVDSIVSWKSRSENKFCSAATKH